MNNRTLYNFEDYCGIEERHDYSGINGTRGTYQYRFYSKYNGMRGKWWNHITDAKEDGEAHIKLIRRLINRR